METQAVWTVVANIVSERAYGPGGLEKRSGTKQFRPGTKVYIIDWYAGMCERIIVVGQARKSLRFIRIVIPVTCVTNLRTKLCYNPAAIKKIKEHKPNGTISWLTEEFVTSICKTIPYWQKELSKSKKPENGGLWMGSLFKKIWSRLL